MRKKGYAILLLCNLFFISAVPIDQGKFTTVVVPDQQMSKSAVAITIHDALSMTAWSDEVHKEVFAQKKKLAAALREEGCDILFFQKTEPNYTYDTQVVPFVKSSWIKRNYQLLATIFRAKFSLKPTNALELAKYYQQILTKPIGQQPSSSTACIFPCEAKLRDKQLVFSGEKAFVLYNIKQVTSQKNDFLIMPKTHYEHMADIDEATGLEMSQMMAKIARFFHRQGYRVYFFQKNGISAGQTVPHFHIHAWAEPMNVSEYHLLFASFKNFFFPSRCQEAELKALVEKKKLELHDEFTFTTFE